MPSLVLFNQRTLFSGDDLRLYAVGSTSIRIIELCVACALLYVVLQQEEYELDKLSETTILLQDDDEALHPWWSLCGDDDDEEEQDIEAAADTTSLTLSLPDSLYFATHGRIASQIYSTCYILLSLVSIILLVIMFVASGKGTPTLRDEREHILHPLCHFRLTLLNVVTCLVFIMGLTSIWNINNYCETYYYSISSSSSSSDRRCYDNVTAAAETNNDTETAIETETEFASLIRGDACPTYDVWYTLLLILVIFHGFGVMTVMVSFGYFGCFGCCCFGCNLSDTCNTCCIQTASTPRTLHDINRNNDDAKGSATPNDNAQSTTRDITPPGTNFWRTALHCCCGISSLLSCCIFGGSEVVQLGDFSDFALALSDYFHHNGILDVTPSDVVAGLLMVRRKQQETILKHRTDIVKQLTILYDSNQNQEGHNQPYRQRQQHLRRQEDDDEYSVSSASSEESSAIVPATTGSPNVASATKHRILEDQEDGILLFDPDVSTSSDGYQSDVTIHFENTKSDTSSYSDDDDTIELEDLADISEGDKLNEQKKASKRNISNQKHRSRSPKELGIKSASSLSLSMSSLDTSLVFGTTGKTARMPLNESTGNNNNSSNRSSIYNTIGSTRSRHSMTRQQNTSWSHSMTSREVMLHDLLGQDPVLRPMFRDILNPVTHARDRYIIAEGARFSAMAEAIYSWLMYLLERPVTGCCDLGYRTVTSCACCYCCCCCLCLARRHPKCRQQCGCDIDDVDDDDSLDEGCGYGDQSDQINNPRSDKNAIVKDEEAIDPRISEDNTNARQQHSRRRVKRHVIVHDNPCRAHSFALRKISGLDRDDIVYAQFHQGIEVKPYGIMLDHEWKSVVLAIRGTLSLEDCLADVMVRPSELTELGKEFGFDGQDRYCHSGMMASAEWIYRDLERHGKLNKLLLGEHAEFKNYRLRITGHSYGAGCAAVLSYLLRPKFPNLRCLAFSPPGCVACPKLSEELAQWTTSYVLDADIVPRLSIQSFEALRHEVLGMVCRIKIPKYQVIGYRRKTGTKDREALVDANSRTLYDSDEIPNTRFHKQVQEFFDFESVVKQKRDHSSHELYVTELYSPGKIVHLFRTEEKAKILQDMSPPGRRASALFGLFNSSRGGVGGGGGSAGSSSAFLMSDRSRMPESEVGAGVLSTSSSIRTTGNNGNIMYTARWAEKEDLRKIILSKHSLTDHNPISLKNQLRRMAEQAGLEPPYSNVLSADNIFRI